MEITILTLFPNMFYVFLSESIIARAIKTNKVKIKIINFRDYSVYNNKQVDDTPYGGGSGMVLMCDPLFRCIDDIKRDDSYIILMCPTGKTFTEKKAKDLAKKKHLIIICGHYEGFDERIKSLADEIISIGDYVLTGGEIPAMAITDAITRLIPGVITSGSLDSESFSDNLLDYPTYTKPEEYRGMKVPDILLSGNHQKIDEYREEERKRVTKENRQDLLGE
jgi:tRNA (guanine37-N1)-methyltransferase